MVSNLPVKRVLLVAANPRDVTRLRLDAEFREIEGALERAQHRDRFVLEKWEALRTEDFRRTMLRSPQIVHFSGHGEGIESSLGDSRSFERTNRVITEQEGLIFEDDLGNSKLVSGEALAGLFELCKDHIECVVLNSCYSVVQAEAIAQHIPYVIGMKRAIGDKAAIEFSKGFYDALGAGRSIEDAFEFGRNAIQLEGIPEHLTPKLIAKKDATQNFPVIKALIEGRSKDGAIELFFSYAHKDEALRDELAAHLSNMKRQSVIKDWHDRQIFAGTEWEGKIDEHLETSRIILLLVSADFMASDYCYDIEVKRAMERHERGEAIIIPILLRPVEWKDAPFAKLQPLPKNYVPITKWNNRDEAFLAVAKGIREVANGFKKC